jgi:hypothetical protein
LYTPAYSPFRAGLRLFKIVPTVSSHYGALLGQHSPRF